MTQLLNQQPDLIPGKTQLEMAELLLNQNTLGLQIMFTNKMNQSEPFSESALKFLEESIRCNHFLSYNLIMSYISEQGIAQALNTINPANEISLRNEQNLQEQEEQQQNLQEQEEQQQRSEERKEQQEQQVQEEQKEDDTFSDDGLFIDFIENYGLTKNQINKLPKYKWTELFNDESTSPNLLVKSKQIHKAKMHLSSTQESCCICLSKYRTNSKLRKLPCGHYFHLTCIDRWLKKNSKCPFCRKAIEKLNFK